jgi:threonine aldolase
VVTALEVRICMILGKPAAAFMPTGTVAQQIALRIRADRRQSRTAVFQPTAHVDRREMGAYRMVHRLEGFPVGAADRLASMIWRAWTLAGRPAPGVVPAGDR